MWFSCGGPVGCQLGQTYARLGSRVEFTDLLVALGRTARTTGLGPATAGVKLSADGPIVVDRHLRTTNPRSWSAGDLTGARSLAASSLVEPDDRRH
ncbi:MAG: FAD-dependent oxidoreductase [Propionibacteriaceae bacterium]